MSQYSQCLQEDLDQRQNTISQFLNITIYRTFHGPPACGTTVVFYNFSTPFAYAKGRELASLVAQMVKCLPAMQETRLIPGSGRAPGEGNGTPLQYSCLENPMFGGAWQAAAHGVTKSRTRLNDFTSLHIYIYNWITLLYSINKHNIVNQLYFNKV